MRYAVVDSGPLIKGTRLEALNAEVLVTVPEVLDEIRDKRAREMLAAMPQQLETREPSHEALEEIRRFAKLTGDFPALSRVDTRVLALAWMLEKETKGGVGHLRTEPPPPRAQRPSRGDGADEPSAAAASAEAASEAVGEEDKEEDHEEEQEKVVEDADAMDEAEEEQQPLASDADLGAQAAASSSAAPPTASSSGASTAASSAGPSGDQLADGPEAVMDISDAGVAEAATSSAAAARQEARRRAEASEAAAVELDTGDDLPWITVENLKHVQAHDSRFAHVPDDRTTVACLTTDYAMQSVLMQMGMRVIAADGLLMRSIKQWVLRCSGCNTQQPSLDRQFCTKCGNNTLVRLVAIVDSRGSQRLLPEKGAPARVRSTNIRGAKFPMPKPKAGRHAQNLILAEDQLAEANEKFQKQGKGRLLDVFDPDYSLDDHFGRSGKKGGGVGAAPRVGYGKRANPNDVRSRPKHT